MKITRKHIVEMAQKRQQLDEALPLLYGAGALALRALPWIIGGYTAYDTLTDDEIGIGGSVWQGEDDSSTAASTAASDAGANAAKAGSIYQDYLNKINDIFLLLV